MDGEEGGLVKNFLGYLKKEKKKRKYERTEKK